MNILLLVDKKIRQSQLDKMKSEVASLYKTNCNITLKWFEESRDFTTIPTEWYRPEDMGIKKTHIKKVAAEIYDRYAEEIDEVVFLIHKDNWTLEGVWGWNMSNVYNGYGIQQCRFDSRNVSNSIGTLYHELHHDHDTFIYTYTGIKIERVVGVVDWDDDITHGGRYSGRDYGWDYIRYKENQDSLVQIKPFLQKAIKERRSIFTTKVGLMEKIIQLQKQLIVLLRQKQAGLRGDLAIKINNVCSKNY